MDCVRETSKHRAIKQSANLIIATATAAAILIKRHERRYEATYVVVIVPILPRSTRNISGHVEKDKRKIGRYQINDTRD